MFSRMLAPLRNCRVPVLARPHPRISFLPSRGLSTDPTADVQAQIARVEEEVRAVQADIKGAIGTERELLLHQKNKLLDKENKLRDEKMFFLQQGQQGGTQGTQDPFGVELGEQFRAAALAVQVGPWQGGTTFVLTVPNTDAAVQLLGRKPQDAGLAMYVRGAYQEIQQCLGISENPQGRVTMLVGTPGLGKSMLGLQMVVQLLQQQANKSGRSIVYEVGDKDRKAVEMWWFLPDGQVLYWDVLNVNQGRMRTKQLKPSDWYITDSSVPVRTSPANTVAINSPAIGAYHEDWKQHLQALMVHTPLCPSKEIVDVVNLNKPGVDEEQVHKLIELYGQVFRSVVKSVLNHQAALSELARLDRQVIIAAEQIALYGLPMEGDKYTDKFPSMVFHMDGSDKLQFASAQVAQMVLTKAAKGNQDKLRALLLDDDLSEYLGTPWETMTRRLLLESEEFLCYKMELTSRKRGISLQASDKPSESFKLSEGSKSIPFNNNQFHDLVDLGPPANSLYTPTDCNFPSIDDIAISGAFQTSLKRRRQLDREKTIYRGVKMTKAWPEVAKVWWSLQTHDTKSQVMAQDFPVAEMPLYYVQIHQRIKEFRVISNDKSALEIPAPIDDPTVPTISIVPYVITPRRDPWTNSDLSSI